MADSYTYPLDRTGTATTNKVTETRTLNNKSRNGFNFIVPKAAPFFRDGLKVYLASNTTTPLVEGKDYILTHHFLEGSRETGLEIYGGILFNDKTLTGSVKLTLQTLGGQYTLPTVNTVEAITRSLHNVLFCTWSEVVNLPQGFSPIDHVHDSADAVGFEAVNQTLERMIVAILANAPSDGSGSGVQGVVAALSAHLNSLNAHDKAAVGLGSVANYPIASYNDIAYSRNDRYITASLLRYAISTYGSAEDVAKINTKLTEYDQKFLQISQSSQTSSAELQNLQESIGQTQAALEQQATEVGLNKDNINFLAVRVDALNDFLSLLQVGKNNTDVLVEQMRQQLSLVTGQVSSSVGIVAGMSALINTINEDIAAMKLNIAKNASDIDALNKDLIYPLNRFINAGTLRFKIAKGQLRYITLIAGGGGAGVQMVYAERDLCARFGENGGDTILYCNTDLTNGNHAIAANPVMIAFGGTGGGVSYNNDSGIVNYGKAGLGGSTEFANGGLVTIIDNAQGAPGEAGISGAGIDHAGGIGREINSIVFGSGSAAPLTAGSGGAGGHIVGFIKNDFDFDLEFTLVVGQGGHSMRGSTTRGMSGAAAITATNI